VSGVGVVPCVETWPGAGPFSEPETQNIRDYVGGLDPAPVFTLAMHSAAELLLFPYSYSPDVMDSVVI